MLQVLAFGQLTDIIGQSEIQIEFVSTVGEIKNSLTSLYPALKDKTYVIAVDNKLMGDEAAINAGNVIALLPPFSGG